MELKNVVKAIKKLFIKENVIETAKTSDGLQARIIVSTLSYNNSAVIVDEDGEERKPPMPAPVDEELLVKQGDRVNGFEVADVMANFVVLKSDMEYTVDNDSAPKTEFIIEKGGCTNLTMYGMYDAVHKTSIRYIESQISCDGE